MVPQPEERESMNALLAARRVLVLAFLLTAALSHAEQTNHVVVVGKASFTVIAPECIRIEYAKDGAFVDAKSMFAVGRDAACHDFKLSHDSDAVTIDTGRIRLRYRADEKPFDPDNLQAQILRG